jgi:hypothetical protein
MDSYWISYYRFGTNLGCSQENILLKRLAIMERISASCGFWYPRDGICIISDRFLNVHFDNSRNNAGLPFRLHKEDGPAIEFRDTWSLYYWHGIRLASSQEWIIKNKKLITKEKILTETNSEIRRIMCEVVGWKNALKMLGSKIIDYDEIHGQKRELLEIEITNQEKIRIVKLINGTQESDGTRHEFLEGVPLEIQTSHDAEAWQYGISPSWYKEACRT